MRGISKGESTRTLTAELGLSYTTVLRLRHEVQANAMLEQTEEPLPDISLADQRTFYPVDQRTFSAVADKLPADQETRLLDLA